MTERAGAIAAFVTHARAVPASDRERFAGDVRARVEGHGLVLETCHRVEAYAGAPALDAALGSVELPTAGRRLDGEAAIRHLVAVAVGRDSVVVGEDQVLHQLRTAFEAARANGIDPTLDRLLTMALRAGRTARSWRAGPERSLATLAVSVLEGRVGALAGRTLLVVGAGRIGRLAARAGRAIGADVSIANRTTARAAALAAEVGAHAVAFDPGPDIREFDAVVVALGAPWPIAPETLAGLADAGTPVLDLSVPAAFDDDAALTLGTALISADDLARLEVAEGGTDERAAARLDRLVDQTTADFLAWLDRKDRRATAAELARRAADARDAELRDLWRRLPELDAAAREAIEAMASHLADQLLREPFEHLSHDPDGAAEQAVREVFAL